MTMINPLAAALAAVLEQAVQAALQASNDRLEAHIARLDAHVHQLDALADRVATLEKNEDALVRRIAVLEQSSSLDKMRLDDMAEKIVALETKLTEASLFTQNTNVTIPIDEAKMVEALNSQEWFWEKLTRKAHEAAEAVVEEALDSHTSDYDHDEYDSHLQDDDRHPDSDIEDAVRSALNGTSVTLSF